MARNASHANETEPRDEAGIEITPEMIEAGVPILFDYDPRFSNENDIVAAIFRAMAKARPTE